ncbi:LOW QUALITY PROTEIN: ras-specific guanine nucleotide-releasing factor 2 [Menidia menidia]
MQKSVRYNEGHALYLSAVARKEGTKRGFLSKKTPENSRWGERFFALHQNLLFYFENEQSARPSGIYLLEGCTCERAPAPKATATNIKEPPEKQQHYFLVVFGHDGQKPLELRTEDESDCNEWVESIQQASYSDIIVEREILMQKYIHLVQILETEKVAANQLRTQLEDQDTEIERLKAEIVVLNKAKDRMLPLHGNQEEEDPDIKKIKKVQSFMRGWLCRRKWKLIVQDYICSPHAESMRKRNHIVFNMVEAEAEYVHQLSVLVNGFLRPLRMAASSKKPPVAHDDVSSIFLNSETIMFLHEIFHQGLMARIASWPTLVLADLFDILLPMLNIYQEFVRNHQYSLQVLANCKQNRDFDKLLKQYESNAACEGRMLETFLTYPMFQVPPPPELSRFPVCPWSCFFATNQGAWGADPLNSKSPRLIRKFSSPPPSPSPPRTSSPVHSRKLSLSSPWGGKAGALDLSGTPPLPPPPHSPHSPHSPTSIHSPSLSSPPPTSTRSSSGFSSPPARRPPFPGTPPGPPGGGGGGGGGVSPESSPLLGEDVSGELPRLDAFCGKLRRSIRRAVLESVSLDKFIPESPTAGEPGDAPPCRSPSTPRHLRYRPPGAVSGDNARCAVSPASAFAIATAAAGHTSTQGFSNSEKTCDKEFIIRRAATNRVLNVLRHWVSKHSQDFELNGELKTGVSGLLEEVLRDPDLLPQERKATANILSALSQEEPDDAQLKVEDILQMKSCPLLHFIAAEGPKAEGLESLSAMELAEQITLLDHIVFRSIPYEEFLGQGWMKEDKMERTPFIMKTSQHFNDMSNLVASQILAQSDLGSRAGAIEKWLAVADICRCLNNYNGVLEITAALNRSALFRLKKTWAKVCKQTKALMDRLQKTVSSEGRFKNLRETLKNCNPPCVPYLGMYLTDLAFIEEGTPNFTEEGLVNFSKMRMISHIIREIRQFQQAPYRIEHQPKVTQFLLDKTLVMDEDTLYELSLKIEPRVPPG